MGPLEKQTQEAHEEGQGTQEEGQGTQEEGTQEGQEEAGQADQTSSNWGPVQALQEGHIQG
jgi:hypothetical protein